MQKYNNQTGVSLAMAVYLATDHYDHIPGVISATGLMKPIRQTILKSRVPVEMKVRDIIQGVKSRLGTSLHDGLEKAWQHVESRKKALDSLGYPAHVIDNIIVNSSILLRHYGYDERSFKDTYLEHQATTQSSIPVYMEIRGFKAILGREISGKFDFVAEGMVRDLKSTGTYTWTKNLKVDDYILQQSIYRWIHPNLITQDTGAVEFLFTDWAAGFNKSEDYPDAPIMTKYIPLLSLEETEHYVVQKLRQLDQYQTQAETDLPFCTDVELWRDAPVFKYYKNAEKRDRSTKNFETASEAYSFMAKQGGVGIVLEVPSQVKACKYCDAFPICTQKDRYIVDGSLKI